MEERTNLDGLFMDGKSPLLTRKLQRADICLTALGFGGAPIGNLYEPVSDEDAADTIRAALVAGVEYFDTAPFYGVGVSETRLGKALGHTGTISTKVGRLLDPEQTPSGEMTTTVRFDYSADGITRSIEASLNRLGRETLDIVLVHDIGRRTHGRDHAAIMATLVNDTLPELRRLQSTGMIGAIGIGVNEVEVCLETLDVAEIDLVMVSGRYTLIEQEAADALLPRCLERGVAVVLGGVFNSGILADRSTPGATFDYAAPSSAVAKIARRIYEIAAKHDVDVGAAALQFALAHPAVASIIPGARSTAEVAENVARYGAPIPAMFWDDLRADSIIPAHAPVPG